MRAELPPEVRPARVDDARDWLRYLRALRRERLRTVPYDAAAARDDPDLAGLPAPWARDLVAVTSPSIRVLTSLERPGSVAAMLVRGEALCAALEAWFATDEPRRSERPRLDVELFEDEGGYLARSAARGHHAGLDWTAGHYDPASGTSRFYVPSLDSAGWDAARDTFLHELTHHWLDRRCPAFPAEVPARGTTPEGYWVVEGFAGLAESLDFEPYTREVVVGARPGDRLAQVAVLEPEALLPWERVVSLANADLPRLAGRDPVEGPALLRLGQRFELDRVGRFYAQATLLARYLFEAEGEAARRALLDYLVAYYRGDASGLDFERAFGAPPAVLGARAHAWARSEVADFLGRR